MKLIQLSLTFLFTLISCHLPQQIEGESKHRFNDNSHNARVLTCNNQQDAEIGHQGQAPATQSRNSEEPNSFQQEKENINAYLDKIKNHVMANNAEAFQGNLDLSAVCVKVDDSPITWMFGANASADAETGEIYFTPELLINPSSDAEVAWIMSHELAHISMNHPSSITYNFRTQFIETIGHAGYYNLLGKFAI